MSRVHRELAVVALIVGGLAFLIWPAVNVDCTGSTGSAIPAGPPDEARRLRHPAGFSVIVPPDWQSREIPLRKDDPSLRLFPQVPKGPSCPVRRAEAGLVIANLGAGRPPALDGFQRIAFQGRAAYERMDVTRTSTFDDQARSEYTMYIERDADWFLVTYFIAEARTELPSSVRDYIETIRWD